MQDKRNDKRAGAKKSRRNRHYEKQLIRNAITAGALNGVDAQDSPPAGRADDARTLGSEQMAGWLPMVKFVGS